MTPSLPTLTAAPTRWRGAAVTAASLVLCLVAAPALATVVEPEPTPLPGVGNTGFVQDAVQRISAPFLHLTTTLGQQSAVQRWKASDAATQVPGAIGAVTARTYLVEQVDSPDVKETLTSAARLLLTWQAPVGPAEAAASGYRIDVYSGLTGVRLQRHYTASTQTVVTLKSGVPYRVRVTPGNAAGFSTLYSELELTPPDTHTPAEAAVLAEPSPVDRQLAYVRAHWNHYNRTEFSDFNVWGGDCMNFVSQSLLARGWTMNSQWRNKQGKVTGRWTYVPAFDEWLKKSGKKLGATRLKDSQASRAQLKPGDLVLFDYENNKVPNHIMIVMDTVTLPDGSIDVIVAGHNLDTIDGSLTQGLANPKHKGKAIAWFYSLTDQPVVQPANAAI